MQGGWSVSGRPDYNRHRLPTGCCLLLLLLLFSAVADVPAWHEIHIERIIK